MFWEKLLGGGDQKEENDVDTPMWESVQLNEAGVSVKVEKNGGLTEHYNCIGVWESPTRYMLSWGEKDRKVFIGKEDVVSIEVQ
jgi:hypothetical protein